MNKKLVASVSAFLLTLGIDPLLAQKAQQPSEQRETVAKPLSAREQRKRDEKLRKELESPYKKWLSEDVQYIITPEEQAAWKRLSTDEEREQFVEQFWLRRDPTPDTVENEYREEHYRRIAYANDRFASGIPGWKTDRGMVYIRFGPPDEIEDKTGGQYERPIEEGGGTTSVYPFQKWRYRYIEGIGTDVNIEFVDKSMTGEYRMTMDPTEKDALLYVPNAGLTLFEELGMADKADRFTRTDGTHLGTGDQPLTASMNQFERLRQYSMLQRAPEVKYKDLEAAVNSTIRYNLLPLQVRADYIRLTDSTIQTLITIQFDKKDIQYQEKEGVAKSVVNVFGRVTSISRRPITTFEDNIGDNSVPPELLQQAAKGSAIWQKAITLAPGSYRLSLAVKDVIGGNMTTYDMPLIVPYYEDEQLAMSSLILADKIEKVPTRSVGAGDFVIGGSKVRPRLSEAFKKNEKVGIYLQLYNFTPDEQTQKPNAVVEYEVVKNGSNKEMFQYQEEVAKVAGASARQYTIEKLLPLTDFEPGEYTLNMKVIDRNSNETLTPSATFKVE